MRAARWVLLLGCSAQAHEVITTKLTWSREISRIVYRRCVSCHREGGPTPMSLMTYEEARPWAKAIKEEVLERRMPPWGAVKGFGDFRDDVSLSGEEILLLADWVEGGAPEGDPALAPYPPDPRPAWKPQPSPRGLRVDTLRTIAVDTDLRSIAPGEVPEGGSLKVVAERPDGVIEPLLWLLKFQPKWRRTYTYRTALSLPKGTRVRVWPPEAGSVTLVTAAPSRAR